MEVLPPLPSTKILNTMGQGGTLPQSSPCMARLGLGHDPFPPHGWAGVSLSPFSLLGQTTFSPLGQLMPAHAPSPHHSHIGLDHNSSLVACPLPLAGLGHTLIPEGLDQNQAKPPPPMWLYWGWAKPFPPYGWFGARLFPSVQQDRALLCPPWVPD